MGKSSGKKADKSAGRMADQQAKLAQRLVDQSDPTRQYLYADVNEFLQSGDVTGLPEYQAIRATMEPQYQRARDSIIASMPEGGALGSALAGAEMDRVLGLTQGVGALASDATNRAFQLGTFGAAQGSQGFAQAGQIHAQRAQNKAMENAAKSSALGGGLGMAAGGYLGNKPQKPAAPGG